MVTTASRTIDQGADQSADEMWIEWVPLAQLATWPSNPKAHDHATLGESFERFGFIDPIILDEGSARIVAGHGRRERLLQMKETGMPAPGRVRVREDGEWLVPVLRGIRFSSEHEAEAYLLASNQTVIKGGYDEQSLLDMLARHDDLAGLGWSQDEVETLTVRVREEAEAAAAPAVATVELQEDGEVPEPPKNPITKLGDIWQLGTHRLICGDARRRDVVARVLGGVVPFIMVTDPPYGVEYDPEWRHRSGLNDSKRIAPVTNDHEASWRQAYALFPGDVAYVWCASLKSDVVIADLERSNFLRRAQIVWNKGQFVVGRGHYHWQHEPCWYVVRKGATARWCGNRDKSTIWDIPSLRRQGSDDMMTEHATQKPVACMGRPIQNHGAPGDTVYDAFAGSGTTIVAAEQLERHCIAVERDPAWCDVIVERWQKLSGATAKRVGR